MAYNKILLKRRDGTDTTPTLEFGELGWNQLVQKLYIGTNAIGGGVLEIAGEGSFLSLSTVAGSQTVSQDIILGGTSASKSQSLFFEDNSADKTKMYQDGGNLVIATLDGGTWTDQLKVQDSTDLVWANNGFITGSIKLETDGSGGKLTPTGTNGGVTLITTGTGKVIIDADTTGAGVEISAGSQGVDINSAGTVSIDATGSAKAVTITSNNDKVTITGKGSSAGAVKLHADSSHSDTTVEINSAGTGTSAINIDSTGGVDVDAAALIDITSSAGDVALTATTKSVSISGGENAADAVRIQASNAAGGIDIDAGSKGILVDTTGTISLDAAAASNFNTSVGAITVDGKTGVNIKQDGTSAIIVASDADVSFPHTGGATGDADFTVAGYAKFTDAVEVDNIKIDGNTITSLDANGNINLTPAGTGEVNITKVDIDSGTIDGVVLTGGTIDSLVTSTGGLNVTLTGTVAVTTGSTAVSGTGTLFNTELVAGDAIKIDGVPYEVDSVTNNSSLVLSSNATTTATGEAVYGDSNLFKVQTGYGTSKFEIDKSGNVDIKTGALTVAGNLTVNGTTTTINTETIQVDDNILILGDVSSAPSSATVSDFGVSWARAVASGGSFVRKYGGMVWDESTDQIIISDDLGSTNPGSATTINSYADFRANHVRIGSDTINRDVQWQKVYDKIWASAVGDTGGTPDSLVAADLDKLLMVKAAGSGGYEFQVTDTLDGGTW
jgi:hypothetical protein